MGLFGGGQNTTNQAERVGQFKVDTAVYGEPIPIIFGTQRVPGNIIDFRDFTSHEHRDTQHTGKGGGGGSTTTNITYTYTVALALALCQGEIHAVSRVWKGKEILKLAELNAKDTGKTSQLLAAIFSIAGNVNQLNDVEVFYGTDTQGAWDYMLTKHPADALNYRGIAYVAVPNMDLGDSGRLSDNMTFEVSGPGTIGVENPDAEPHFIIQQLLTNEMFGAGFPQEMIGDLSQYKNYCDAMGIYLSPLITDETEAQELITKICESSNSQPVYTQGKLKIIPYCDEFVEDYVPVNNGQPLYDLTDDDFIGDGDEDPIKITRKDIDDAYNVVSVEYLNREKSYNVEVEQAKDLTNIEVYGLRPMDQLEMHYVTKPDVAKVVAQQVLQRKLYVRNKFEFQLGWKHILLDPMDIVTLTSVSQGLDKEPVRIISIEEDEDGVLNVIAEECPFGVHGVTRYPTQNTDRPIINVGVDAGDVADPVIFMPPTSLTGNKVQLWMSIAGQLDEWGGCRIWASDDGNSYQLIGTVNGPARYGHIESDFPAGSVNAADNTHVLPVNLEISKGILSSGSQADFENNNILAWVNGEIISYKEAQLTASHKYDISTIRRGLYNSNPIMHANGAKFVRLDESIFKYDLTGDRLGKTIFLKFTSFNVYARNEQSLADVEAKVFTVPRAEIPEVTGIHCWTNQDDELLIEHDPSALVDFQEYRYYVEEISEDD